MDESLRAHISQIYGAEWWDPITGKLWYGDDGFQLFKFEQDVEYDGATWRCVIIEKEVYDAEISLDECDHSEDVFSKAWKL